MSLELNLPDDVLEKSLSEEHLVVPPGGSGGGVDQDGRLIGAATVGVVIHPSILVWKEKEIYIYI